MLNRKLECKQYWELPLLRESTEARGSAARQTLSETPISLSQAVSKESFLDRTVFRLSYREITKSNGLERAMVTVAAYLLSRPYRNGEAVCFYTPREVKELLSRWSGAAPRKQYIRLQDETAWTAVPRDVFFCTKRSAETAACEELQTVSFRTVRETKLCRPHVLYYFAAEEVCGLTDDRLLAIAANTETETTVFSAETDCEGCPHRDLCKDPAISEGFLTAYLDRMQLALDDAMQENILRMVQLCSALSHTQVSCEDAPIPAVSAAWLEACRDELRTIAADRIEAVLKQEGLKASLAKNLRAYADKIKTEQKMDNIRDFKNHQALLADFFPIETAYRCASAAKDAFEQKESVKAAKKEIQSRAADDMKPLFLAKLDEEEMNGTNAYKALSYEKAIAMALDAGAPARYYLAAKHISAADGMAADAAALLKLLSVCVEPCKTGSEAGHLDRILKMTAAYLLARGSRSRAYVPVNWTDISNWGLYQVRIETDAKLTHTYQYTQNDGTKKPIFFKTTSLHQEDKKGNVSFLYIDPDWIEACGWVCVEESDLAQYRDTLFFRDDGSGKSLVCCKPYDM